MTTMTAHEPITCLHDLYLDDFKVGDRYRSEGQTVTESEIIAFGAAWDPQPFHIDAHAVQAHAFGRLFASGFHTLCVTFRLFQQQGLLRRCNIASPGFDSLRWLKPVWPGDTLYVESEVREVSPSRSKPDRGTVRMLHETLNQHGDAVMSVDCIHMLKRRPEGEAGPA